MTTEQMIQHLHDMAIKHPEKAEVLKKLASGGEK